MPLSQFDILNLNRSMSDLGDTFRQRRLDKEQRDDEMRREMIQQKMAESSANRQERGLAIEQKRLETEQGRTAREGEGQLDVYLKGQNGGSFHFRGPKSGYDKFVSEMESKGQPVTPTDQPLPRSAYGSYKFSTDQGDVEITIENPDQLDAISQKVKSMGGRPTPRTAPLPAAGIQYESQAQSWETQAQQLEGTDPETAGKLREAAQRLRAKNNPPVGNTGFTRTTIGPDPFTGQLSTNVTTQVPGVGSAAPAASGKVRMINPAGVAGMVPAGQVEAAKKQGYRLAPQ